MKNQKIGVNSYDQSIFACVCLFQEMMVWALFRSYQQFSIISMGNLISQSPSLYTLDLPPPNNADHFILLKDESQIPYPLHGKILVPTSKMAQRRTLISQYHHHVILVGDEEEGQFLRLGVKGVPIVDESQMNRIADLWKEAHFNCQFCPIPLVLQRFHESYVKNYVNSFHFYGVRVYSYGKVENYIRAQCTNRFLICSNYQLDQLSFKMKNRVGAGDPSKKLTVLCFCNKQEYTLSKRLQLFLTKEGIQVVFFQNLLDIIERISSQGLVTPRELEARTQKILFYLSEKEKEVQYLSKMAKRLQKSVRNTVVQKVNSKSILLEMAERANYSIILMSNDAKEMRASFELCEELERAGLEDRVIFIRRDNEINQKLTQRIYSVIEKPKYRKTNILEKELIFFGTTQSFKTILRSFPSLKFKRLIDSTRQKDQLLPYLEMQTEVVVSNIRICSCQEEYTHQNIHCRVIQIYCRTSTVKNLEKRQSTPKCQRERWFLDEEQLINHFLNDDQKMVSPLLSLNFNYKNKRMSYLGHCLNQCFSKMKEKKTILYNKLNDSMFLFSSEYYTLDQLATHVLKYFSTKMLGNYEQQCMFVRIKAALHEQLVFLAQSSRVEQQVIDFLERDDSADVFELADKVMGLMVDYSQMRQEINSIWALFLYHDRKEHHTNCQTLFFLLFLAFSKTNFLKYSNQTLQGLTLAIKRTTTVYDSQNLATFRNKNRNNFVYNVQFLACEAYRCGEGTPDPNDIIIRIDGNQLMSFGLYLPIYLRGNTAIICPFSKFQINVKPQRESLLKLNVHSQQKLLQKFSQTFLEECQGQLKLINQQREMRRFDAFLDSMAHSRFETAGYLLKKVVREEGLVNQQCLNAYNVLYHLRRKQIEQAQQKLKNDRYFDFLNRVIQAQLTEGGAKQPQQVFSSNKCIQESNKEYQNMDETSNDNESFDSAMIQTDPEMIKHLTSDYRLLNPNQARGRSPSSKLKEINRRKPNKVPIRRKPQLSISDKLSEGWVLQKQQKQDKHLNIIILPPLKHFSGREEPSPHDNNSSTFGNKFMTEYSQLSSQKSKKSSKEDCGSIMRMKSTRSVAGGFCGGSDDGVIQSSPMLNKRTSKPSNFAPVQRTRSHEEHEESRGELISLDPQEEEEHEQTGNFNFAVLQKRPQSLVEMDAVEDSIHEESIQQSESSSEQPSQSAGSIGQLNTASEDSCKPFPIKKGYFKFPRKSLTQMHQNLNLLESPLQKIDEEHSSQVSLSTSTAKFLLCSPQKENEKPRSKQNKLFTFYKISDPTKPRFSLSSNKNSLNLSNTDELGKIEEQSELFFNFMPEKKQPSEDQLQDLHSISSIEIEEAEQVFPEELVQP